MGFIDFRMDLICAPNVFTARLQTLKIVNGAMTFINSIRIKTGFLEMAIHIAGKDPATQWHFIRPAIEQRKALMRCGCTVHRQTVTIKPPSLPGTGLKGCRRCNVIELNPRRPKSWVRIPKTVLATKVRQPRVHPHASARSNNQGIRTSDQLGGTHNFTGELVSHAWSICR
jgi:hypothetical protein